MKCFCEFQLLTNCFAKELPAVERLVVARQEENVKILLTELYHQIREDKRN